MKVKSHIKSLLEKSDFGSRLIADPKLGIETKAVLSLIVNLAFALYNGVLGLASHSVWFGSVCIYYIILATMRFGAVISSRKNSPQKERVALALTGILLMLLSIALSGINYLSQSMDISKSLGTITMITVAAYTFFKLTMAIIRSVRRRGKDTPLFFAIHCIGYAEAAVSLLNMQRSMLATFEGMSAKEIVIFNGALGMAVFLFTLGLGIYMVIKAVKENENVEN